MSERAIVTSEPELMREPTRLPYTLDEAIEATKIGKCQMMLIVLTGLSALGGRIETLNIGVVLPYAKCELDLSTTEQGLLISMSFFGIFATIYLWGFVADTYGRQKVVHLCAMGSFIFAFLSAFAYNVMLLIVLRFFVGAFVAGSVSVTYTYIAEFHPTAEAARAGALASMIAILSWIYLPLPSMLIIPMDWVLWIGSYPFRPWRLLLLCFTSINLCMAIVFSYLPETPRFLVANNRTDEAVAVLRRIYAFNTGESEEMYPVTNIVHETNVNGPEPTKGACNIIRSIWTQTKPIFQGPLSHNTWKMSIVLFITQAIAHGNTVWFPDFMVQLQNHHGEPTILCNIIGQNPSTNVTINSCDNIDNQNITSFQMMCGIAGIFVTISVITSYCMKKFNLKIIVAVWLTLVSAASIALTLFSEFYAIAISYVVILSIAVCSNIQTAYAIPLYPVKCRAVAMSFILMCARLGSVFGGNFIASMLLNNACNGIFYVSAVALAGCLVTFMLVRDRKM